MKKAPLFTSPLVGEVKNLKHTKLFFLLLGVFLIIALDHWSKLLVLKSYAHLPVSLTSFLNLVFVKNRGISFGFFQAGTDPQVFFLCTLACVIVAGLFVWYVRATDKLLLSGLILILGGAIGNVIDRVLWGSVVDFLDFYIRSWHFPAFNLADACITCGTGLVFWTQMMEKSGKAATEG